MPICVILCTASSALKDRANLIPDPERLWQYVGGIARQKHILLLAAGGTANHLHLVISLPPTITLAKAVQELKGNTSRWLNESCRFAWQEGYSAFSVSQSQRKMVTDYIDRQASFWQWWLFLLASGRPTSSFMQCGSKATTPPP